MLYGRRAFIETLASGVALAPLDAPSEASVERLQEVQL